MNPYKRLVCIDQWGKLNKNIIYEICRYFEKLDYLQDYEFIEFPLFNKKFRESLLDLKLCWYTKKDKRLVKGIEREELKQEELNYFTLVDGDYFMQP